VSDVSEVTRDCAATIASPTLESTVSLTVQIEPSNGTPPSVEYRWDTDTDILSAQVAAGDDAETPAAAIELQGADGSWVILDVRAGRIRGVEVAVWPDVRKLPGLLPPDADYASVLIPGRRAAGGSSEIDTPLSAEVDDPERIFHFRLGVGHDTRVVKLASDIMIDVEPSGTVAGLWLLNVPPFPLDL
jgi:hypothetical protein